MKEQPYRSYDQLRKIEKRLLAIWYRDPSLLSEEERERCRQVLDDMTPPEMRQEQRELLKFCRQARQAMEKTKQELILSFFKEII